MKISDQTKSFPIPFPNLPSYFTVRGFYNSEMDSVSVQIESTIHVNKVVKMPQCWSGLFINKKHEEFRSDIMCFIIKRYGLKKVTECYYY